MSGCVVMCYDELTLLVSRRNWTVTMPGKRDEAEYLESLGVGRRARLAVERREREPGTYQPQVDNRYETALREFRRRLARQ